MTARLLPLLTSLALLVAAPAALAQGVPLAGEGKEIQPIAHLPIESPDQQKNEIELAGDYAYVSHDFGMDIINISNPAKPTLEGKWKCEAGWGDIDLSADGNLAVLTNAHGGECFEGGTAIALVDITDKRKPKTLSTITLDDAKVEYVHTAMLSDNLLFLNTQIWAGYPQDNYHVPVYDVTNRKAPKFVNHIKFPGPAVAHDSYLDRRPDGKKIFYSAGVHSTDTFDLTDVMKPVRMQTATTPDQTISHQFEPNHNRSIGILVDESAVDGGLLGSGPAVCGKLGTGAAAFDVGSVQFFKLNEDGTLANGGAAPVGTYNAPPTAQETCTSHVFVQAPTENRMTQAYYTNGARVIDFEDPVNPKELGFFKAEPQVKYWSAKPHRGYIFATDMVRGLDIMRYTGEGGAKWPTTAGAYEEVRAQRHGVPFKPVTGANGSSTTTAPLPKPQGGSTAAERSVGRFAFTAKLKKIKGKKGKKVKLTIVFYSGKKSVQKLSFKRKAGKKAAARVSGVAETGTYRYTVKNGRKTIKRGTFKVGRTAGVSLSPNAKMAARVR